MLDIGFTGSRHGIATPQGSTLFRIMRDLLIGGGICHHGCCVGADERFAFFAKRLASKDYKFDVKVIAYPSDLADLTSDVAKTMSDQVRDPRRPLERNHDIVMASQILLACPYTTTEVLGSGTWATIRHARREIARRRQSNLMPPKIEKLIVIRPDGETIEER